MTGSPITSFILSCFGLFLKSTAIYLYFSLHINGLNNKQIIIVHYWKIITYYLKDIRIFFHLKARHFAPISNIFVISYCIWIVWFMWNNEFFKGLWIFFHIGHNIFIIVFFAKGIYWIIIIYFLRQLSSYQIHNFIDCFTTIKGKITRIWQKS